MTSGFFPYIKEKGSEMAYKKITSEVKMTIGNIKAKFGTVDKRNPQSVYIEYGTFIRPEVGMNSFKDSMKSCEGEIRKMVGNTLKNDSDFSNNFIFIFEVPVDRITPKKRNYLSIQIHMKINPESDASREDFRVIAGNYLENKHEIFNETENILSKYGFSCSIKK